MTDHDIERIMQCVTCACDINKCTCTDDDEDENGMCTKWEKKMTDEEKMKADDEYIAPDLLEFMAAIPDFKERGVEHTAPCPCGGTIHAIRSEYNGHLHARCDRCKSALME